MGRILQIIGASVFVLGLYWVINSDLPLLTLCLLPGPIALILLFIGGKIVGRETEERRHREIVEATKSAKL